MNRNGRKHAARDMLLLIGILGVAVLLSMALSGIYEFAFDGAEHTWADGTAADWEVPVTILDNDYADGDQKIVFKLSKLATSDVGVSIGTFALTVKDNDYDTVVETIEKLNPKYRNVRLHYFEDA